MAVVSDIEEGAATNSMVVITKAANVVTDTSNSSGSRSVESDRPSRRSSRSRILIPVDNAMLQEVAESVEDDCDERNSDLFCICCCDLLRACIIVDIFYFCLMIILAVGKHLIEPHVAETMEATRETDPFYRLYDGSTPNRSYIGIPFALLGILASAKFHQYGVLLMAIWYVVFGIWGAIFGKYLSVILGAFLAYPHVALFLALRKGKITRENYSKEKTCCR